MAALKPAYSEYVSFGGACGEDGFESALPTAYAQAKQRCCMHDLGNLTEDEATAFRRAVCAAIDAIEGETAGAASYTAGGISVSFGQSETRRRTVAAAIERELSGTSLMEVGI